MKKPALAYAKTKVQISCAVTAQLISAFVFAIQTVQFLFFLNIKPSSVLVQPGLSQPFLETPVTVFLMWQLKRLR